MLFFFIELLRKWNYNVGGELDKLLRKQSELV